MLSSRVNNLPPTIPETQLIDRQLLLFVAALFWIRSFIMEGSSDRRFPLFVCKLYAH